MEHAKNHKDKDYVRDPKTNQLYHPGVSLAVGEFFGPIRDYEGFWAMRKHGVGWEHVRLEPSSANETAIPMHLKNHASPDVVEKDYRGFNIIKWWDSYYALAQALGPTNLPTIEQQIFVDYQEQGLCFVAASTDAVKQMVDRSGYRSTPELIEENYKGFNILFYQRKHFALAQALGHVDLMQTGERTLKKYKNRHMCIVGNSLEDIKHLIQQAIFKKVLDRFKITATQNFWKNIALYGNGKHTHKLLPMLKSLEYDFSVKCIVDDLPRTAKLNNIPVISPKDLHRFAVDVIVISSDSFEKKMLANTKNWMDIHCPVYALYSGDLFQCS